VDKQSSRREPPLPNLFEYQLAGGWVVLAGRTDADNEQLSLKLARPKDYWFHIKGMSGSHVILRVDAEEPDRETLAAAAAIAAWHSKARGGGTVPVSCTRARYVSKPRGAERGTVEIRKDFVLKVRPALPAD
jgi:predicted ribosome quality control (RQC) complex YloA/Tae2 family protein